MNHSWQNLHEIATHYGDSFYLIDLPKFQANYREFLAAFQAVYANCQIAYSYKTNYTPRLCQIVNQLGGYAEVVSGMEYALAIRLGVPTERIIFNGPYKRAADYERALLGQSIINIDSSYELELIKNVTRKFPDKSFRIGIRCNFDIGSEQRSRFGFDIENEDFRQILETLRNLPNCHIVGLHCHFLAAQRSARAYAKIAQRMLQLADCEFNGTKLEFIDIGGGFYSRMNAELQAQFTHAIPSFEEYGHTIASVFAAHFPNQDGPELILEPGIALTADIMQFVAKVIDIKRIGTRHIALVAGSIYDIKPTRSTRNLPISVACASNNSVSLEHYDIVGSTCMEDDRLHRDFKGTLKVNDYVVFNNVGAYTNVLRPPFINPAAPILSLHSNNVIEVVRRREMLADIFASYNFSPGELSK